MRFWAKLALFLSAYFPLFLILTIKNHPTVNLIPILLLVNGISLLVWGLILWDTKKSPGEYYKILNVENKTHESLNYLAPYLVAFLNFNLTKWQDVTVLLIFLLIIFVVYMTSDLIYTNPLLAFFQCRIYRVKVCKSRGDCEKSQKIILLLSRNDKFELDKEIRLKSIDRGVFLR